MVKKLNSKKYDNEYSHSYEDVSSSDFSDDAMNCNVDDDDDAITSVVKKSRRRGVKG